MQGCNRTALEVCKLLLSLSPLYDPQCILLTMDYYAIKAQLFHFLLSFPLTLDTAIVHTLHSEQPWPSLTLYTHTLQHPAHATTLDEKTPVPLPSTPLPSSPLPPAPRPPASLLPNVCFSRALAAHHLESKEGREHGESRLDASLDPPALSFLSSPTSSPPPPTPLPSSSSLLQLAVLLYPEVVEPLLKQSAGEKEADKPAWRPLLRRLSSLYPSSSYVDKLVLVYTERSGQLWKTDALLAWLLSTVTHVVHTLDRSSQSLSSFHLLRAALFPRNSPPPPPLASLQRTQFTDAVVRLPPELLLAQAQAQAEEDGRRRGMEGGEGWGGQDGPVLDRMSMEQLRHALEVNGMRGLDVAEDHPLMALLRSLLPWNVVAPQVQGEAGARQGGGVGDGGGQGQGWVGQQPVLVEADAGELLFIPDEDHGEDEEDLGEH